MVDKKLSALLTDASDDLVWLMVPEEVKRLVKSAQTTFNYVIQAKLPLAEPGYGKIWYNPDDRILFFNLGLSKDLSKLAAWKNILQNTPNIDALEYSWTGRPNINEPWVPIRKIQLNQLFTKAADLTDEQLAARNDKINFPEVEAHAPQGVQPFKAIGQAAGFVPGPVTDVLGGPNPISSSLAGGVLGAGLGYGTGWLLEHLFPERYAERGPLRTTTGILGALLGAGPGLAWGAANVSNNLPFGAGFKEVQAMVDEEIPEECRELDEQYSVAITKAAQNLVNEPFINVDQFNQTVLSPEDKVTPMNIRSGTIGLTSSASILRGSPVVSPSDIGRVALGAGTGLAAGTFVGRVLGSLAGLTPEMQNKLQDVGLWGGILKNVIPMAFGA